MYSFTNCKAAETWSLPRHLPFEAVLETVKSRPSMRILLDGQAGLALSSAEEQREHHLKHELWEYLRRHHPLEYHRQAKEFGRANSRRLLGSLRLHDPLFKTTWAMLEHMFDILPESAESLVKKHTHADPAAFLELYGEMRRWAEEVEHRRHRRRHARQAGSAGHGPSPAEARERKRRADLKALVAKVKSGRAEEGDLLRYLELTMRREAGEDEREGGR